MRPAFFLFSEIFALAFLLILAFRKYCKEEPDAEESTVNGDSYDRDSAVEDWNKNTKDGLNDEGELDI